MKKVRLAAVLLAALTLWTCAAALGEDFPPLNAAGFLDEGEFVFSDEEAGIWRYCSDSLWVEITRREQEKPKERWYEAEIRLREGAEGFRMIPWRETKRWTSLNYPYKIARQARSVFAVNSDFAHLRLSQKRVAGILLRGGEIVNTHTTSKKKIFPNLDTLALFADGDMRLFDANAHKAQEYVEMGAVDVLAFGPWLIRDGEINTADIKAIGRELCQRTAVGMAERGHYFVIVSEGRIAESKGTDLAFIAEKMKDLGCTLAINLDGGQSSAMIFMGRQINLVKNKKGNRASARKAAEILAIGTSDLCLTEDDAF